jgi:V8-like Glu-specific endopeptidase
MAAATPDDGRRATAVPDKHKPRKDTIPVGRHFGGVPDVGVLFHVGEDRQAHYCTASVVHSPGRDLLLTAAHCGAGSNVAFVPQYDQRAAPYGVWAVTQGFRDPHWADDRGPGSEYDFAFAKVAPDSGGRRIEDVVGANTLTRTPAYRNSSVTIIGYSARSHDAADRAITCTVPTRQLPGFHQLQFDCHGYWGGTSGSPWLIGFNGKTGKVIGDIGGWNNGGPDTYPDDMTSYSPYYDDRIFALYNTAVKAG